MDFVGSLDPARHARPVVGLLFEQRVLATGFRNVLEIDVAPEVIWYCPKDLLELLDAARHTQLIGHAYKPSGYACNPTDTHTSDPINV